MTATLAPPTLAERLNAAADIIEERGHTHGRLESPEGAVCLMGAVRVAIHGTADGWLSDDECRSFTQTYQAVVLDLGQSPVAWNDAHENGRFLHGKAEAVDLLRRVAAKVAGQ